MNGSDGSSPPLRARLARWLPLVLLAAVAVAVLASGLHRHLSLDTLIANRRSLAEVTGANLALALPAAILLYAAVVALSLPGGLVMTIACGFLFGTLAGGAVAVVGASLGATVIFLVARGSLGAALRARAGPRVGALLEGFRGEAFSYLLFLRLVPVAPFWLVNLAPALAGIALPTYVAATVIGILPATFAFAGIGAGLDSVIAAQEAANTACTTGDCPVHIDPAALVTPELLAALAGLGLISLLPVAVRGWQNRNRRPS